jgi:hypothetical protein
MAQRVRAHASSLTNLQHLLWSAKRRAEHSAGSQTKQEHSTASAVRAHRALCSCFLGWRPHVQLQWALNMA